MANALDMLFQAANALPAPVPGDNEVQVQCIATLFSPSDQEIIAQGPLQFTRGTVSERRGDPAFFSASSFSGPEGDVNNHLSFETKITLTAPAIRRLPPGGLYSDHPSTNIWSNIELYTERCAGKRYLPHHCKFISELRLFDSVRSDSNRPLSRAALLRGGGTTVCFCAFLRRHGVGAAPGFIRTAIATAGCRVRSVLG
jgi:hypothetical protein